MSHHRQAHGHPQLRPPDRGRQEARVRQVRRDREERGRQGGWRQEGLRRALCSDRLQVRHPDTPQGRHGGGRHEGVRGPPEGAQEVEEVVARERAREAVRLSVAIGSMRADRAGRG